MARWLARLVLAACALTAIDARAQVFKPRGKAPAPAKKPPAEKKAPEKSADKPDKPDNSDSDDADKPAPRVARKAAPAKTPKRGKADPKDDFVRVFDEWEDSEP